jgi:ParB family chromosome partitioning protein
MRAGCEDDVFEDRGISGAAANRPLAVCVATTIDMTQAGGAEAKPAAAQLTKAISLDMADHWEATAESYFTRVPKRHLLAEPDGVLKPQTARQVEGMKRDMAAKTIETELKGKRWLPPIMRRG